MAIREGLPFEQFQFRSAFLMSTDPTIRRRVACVLSLVVSLSLYADTSLRPVELVPPTETDSRIAKGVVRLLEGAHLGRHKVDETMSRRMHRLFLDSWDPGKRFYLQSDIDEFAKYETEHAAAIRQGKFDAAYEMFRRFRDRLSERVKWVNELSSAAHDFSKPESLSLDPKSINYAKNEDEARERWRVQVKYELAVLRVNGVKDSEGQERIRKRYRNLLRYMAQVDKEELIERYIDALTSSYDPHTSYMSPRSLDQFNIDIRSSLEGVGALLGQDDGVTIIREIVPGGVIARDGRLKVGDKILAVGEGENGEMVDIEGLRISQVVRLVRGKAGTKVRLEVESGSTKERFVVTLTRARIELEDRKAKGDVIEIETHGKKSKVGVLTLPSFYASDPREGGERRGATVDCRRILGDFRRQNVDAVVLDLRNNGGGLLNEAVQICGLFIDSGPVVQVKDFQGNVRVHRDTSLGTAWDGPLVVVVNKLSASASEIVAGVIQDYRRGIVIGDSSTHGKGSVQQILELAEQMPQLFTSDTNAGALKITLQMFYRVNGDSTQLRGVRSDIVLPSATDREQFSEARMDFALPFDRIPPANYVPVDQVSDELIARLKQQSETRRQSNPDFQRYAQKIAKRLEIAERKTLTFTEESLRQQKKEIGTEDDDEANENELPQRKKEEKFGSEPYTREVLSLAVDLSRERVK
jgi:carboxyl-terminal processing protease